MKNTKKIAFICVALNIVLLLQLCLGTVMALDENTTYTEPEQVVEEVVISEEAIIEAQDGEMQIMAAADCPDENKYNHIFGNPEHNLGDFLASYNGNQTNAYNAVGGAAQMVVASNGIMSGVQTITLNLNNIAITVRGNVIDGIFHIGTFWH